VLPVSGRYFVVDHVWAKQAAAPRTCTRLDHRAEAGLGLNKLCRTTTSFYFYALVLLAVVPASLPGSRLRH